MISFCTKYNPDRQVSCAEKEKLDNSFFGGHMTLADIKEKFGKGADAVWLIPHLESLNEFFGGNDTARFLSERQIYDLAKMIAGEYYYLKVTEFMVFFNWLKLGKYGKMYGRVEPMAITTALISFLNDRNYLIDRRKQRTDEERQQKDTEANPPMSYAEYLKKTGKKPNAIIEKYIKK